MKIGIVGLGLIGGSLGLDLRMRGYYVLGVSRSQTTGQVAVERGVVDEASLDLASLASADVVFICTPIAAIAPTVEQLVPHLSPSTIVTDVGSVKSPIVERLMPVWPNFVGAHPMAGTAESGLDAAVRDLFVNRPYVTTPVETTSVQAVEIVEQIARSLGAKVYRCHPADHDRAVAWISHLPVMTSASLISACMSESEAAVLTLAQQLASSGFRDTSRVGGGNPELGVMMAQYNRAALLPALYAYRRQLNTLIQEIEQEDWQAIAQRLQHTQQVRSHFVQPE